MKGTIRLASGRLFEVFGIPNPEQIDICDIAHSLSNQCRFNGHTCVFYSVAQHCVHVAESLPEELALEGLLHDAAEAYIGDIPTPIKWSLITCQAAGETGYENRSVPWCETRLMVAIAKRFRLAWPFPPKVREMDHCLLVTEMRDLMQYADWQLTGESLGVSPIATKIIPWPPQRAHEEFIRVFERYKQYPGSIES